MSRRSFDEEWREKVSAVRKTDFWRRLSESPSGRLERADRLPQKEEVLVTSDWRISGAGPITADGPAAIGIADLAAFLKNRLGITVRDDSTGGPSLTFKLRPSSRKMVSRWDKSFRLTVASNRIEVTGQSEHALQRASLYLSNYWSLRRNAYLTAGRRRVAPSIPIHIGADLWGGFCTTQAWIHGRETDTNFLELARMGIDAIPIMTLLEDYLIAPKGSPFWRLTNPEAQANRDRLKKLAEQAARYGVRLLLMGYNPKLPVNHPVFLDVPSARGAIQSQGAFRTLCTSDSETRLFLANAWLSLFEDIPELGGLLAITGGEGFYHCFMRSEHQAADCPRCRDREPSIAVSEFINDVARCIHTRQPEALVLTWPYSAGHWSHDRDQDLFIDNLDPEHVIFQTEIDKDSVDWRPAGYAKDIWDYSISRVTPGERILRQRARCRRQKIRFSVKVEVNNSIECLNVPYLPVLDNQVSLWRNAKKLNPFAVHSRWLFDGSCRSPSEEIGFWTLWGGETEYCSSDAVLKALCLRDFGPYLGPKVLKAWTLFSAAIRHHPSLDYYVGSYFIGPAQPLVLTPDPSDLDSAFYGVFYWQWEVLATDDDTAMTARKPLFYSRPGFRAIARRGPAKGQDVALQELQTMASIWERGVLVLRKADPSTPGPYQKRFVWEFTLAQHLAYTWRSAANVEEFLRLRDLVNEFVGSRWVRAGHRKENLRDVKRMTAIAVEEREIARRDLELVGASEALDLRYRLDMGVASTTDLLEAKIRQLDALLTDGLPALRQRLCE